MQFRFGEFFFLLASYPKMVGHMGVLATHMFYDPKSDLYIISSLGSDKAMEKSVRLLIEALGSLLQGR